MRKVQEWQAEGRGKRNYRGGYGHGQMLVLVEEIIEEGEEYPPWQAAWQTLQSRPIMIRDKRRALHICTLALYTSEKPPAGGAEIKSDTFCYGMCLYHTLECYAFPQSSLLLIAEGAPQGMNWN